MKRIAEEVFAQPTRESHLPRRLRSGCLNPYRTGT